MKDLQGSKKSDLKNITSFSYLTSDEEYVIRF